MYSFVKVYILLCSVVYYTTISLILLCCCSSSTYIDSEYECLLEKQNITATTSILRQQYLNVAKHSSSQSFSHWQAANVRNIFVIDLNKVQITFMLYNTTANYKTFPCLFFIFSSTFSQSVIHVVLINMVVHTYMYIHMYGCCMCLSNVKAFFSRK